MTEREIALRSASNILIKFSACCDDEATGLVLEDLVASVSFVFFLGGGGEEDDERDIFMNEPGTKILLSIMTISISFLII